MRRKTLATIVADTSGIYAIGPRRGGVPCQSPAEVEPVVRALIPDAMKEHFVVLYLDARRRLLEGRVISIGTLTSTLVHPREVFRPAVELSAAAVIVAHNHPSGCPEPSPEDLALTRRLRQSGEILGIELLDHLILGQPDPGRPDPTWGLGAGPEASYVSLRERGVL